MSARRSVPAWVLLAALPAPAFIYVVALAFAVRALQDHPLATVGLLIAAVAAWMAAISAVTRLWLRRRRSAPEDTETERTPPHG